MKTLKKIISSFLAASVIFALSACGEKTTTDNSESEQEPVRTFPSEVVTSKPEETEPVTEEIEEIIEELTDGPHLYLSNTTAKAGETAEITLYVENAAKKWDMCGIHITYPDVFQVEMFNEEERMIEYTRGDASKYSYASIGMLWNENMPEELTSNHLGCVFFTEVFDDNYGLDGDIVTFYVKIPDDAESGTVYPVGFYYMDTDRFSNKEEDKAFERYAFKNWTEGSITIE